MRRCFERGSALFLAIVPTSLPGILVSSQVGFAPMPTLWIAAVPPLACAVVAVLLLDLGRPLPPIARHRLGATSILAALPLLALACFVIAAHDDAVRDLGVLLGLATTHSASAACGIATTANVLAVLALSLGLGGGDEVGRTLALAGCLAVSAPLSILLVGTSLFRTSRLVRRRFAQAA